MSAEIAVLDPGAWLSLTAAGLLPQVAQGCGLHFLIAQVRVDCDPQLEVAKDRVFCERCVIGGPEEIEWLLEYAAVATEDEAAAAALAQCRKLPLISDELKLRRLFSSRTNGTGALLSIAQLLELWEKAGAAKESMIATAISALQSSAYYSPAPTMPGSEWWKSRCARSETPAVQ